MLIEFHCTCGHRQALAPDKLKPALRCSACKSTLRFVAEGKKMDAVSWLAVGGQSGAPRLAVPIPVGATLKLGRAVSGWLALPGEEIDETQTELRIEDDGKLHVKHLSGDGGTWINRAKIITGILGAEDKLRVGPYVMRLMTQATVQESLAATIEPEVIVETEESDEAEAAPAARSKRRRAALADPEVLIEEDEYEATDEESDPGEKWSKGQKIRIAVSGVLILAAGCFLMRSFIWPPVSDEMPHETDFYCPVDGNVVRGAWTAAAGAPICPVCGQRCVGELKYKPELLHPPADEPGEGEMHSAEQATAEPDAVMTSDAGSDASPSTDGVDSASTAKDDATSGTDKPKKKSVRPRRPKSKNAGGAS